MVCLKVPPSNLSRSPALCCPSPQQMASSRSRQTAARSGSAHGESRLPQISAGKPTWEFAHRNKFPRVTPAVYHCLSPEWTRKGFLGVWQHSYSSPAEQGEHWFPSQSILLPRQRCTHPSIPAHSSPKLLKGLGYCGEGHIPGEKLSAKLVSSAQDSFWLISIFATHLSNIAVRQSSGRARKEPGKNQQPFWNRPPPAFPLRITQRKISHSHAPASLPRRWGIAVLSSVIGLSEKPSTARACASYAVLMFCCSEATP